MSLFCSRPAHRPIQFAVATLLASAGLAGAQPTSFSEVAPFAAPTTPAFTQSQVPLPAGVLNYTFGSTLTVKWLKLTLSAPISGDRFLDIDTRVFSADGGGADLFLALYSGTGNLIVTDDVDGSAPPGLAAGLSFGSTAARPVPATPLLRGQDGTLAAGEYWLALVAGNATDVTAGPSNWNIATSASLPLGLFFPGTFFVDLSLSVGNTTITSRPANDDCSAAIIVGESPASGAPVWTGSTIGATNDGTFPCYQAPNPDLLPKDVWFSYIPTQSGFAEIVADAASDTDPVSPLITVYDAGCASSPVLCAQEIPGSLSNRARLLIPVEQGVPRLLAVAASGGESGQLRLSINLRPAPCTLSVPSGAASEAEGTCGASTNEGCLGGGTAEPLSLGQPVTGTLFSSLTDRDIDAFAFTLASESQVSLVFQSKYLTTAQINRLDEAGDCGFFPVLSAATPSLAALCSTITAGQVLPAGNYQLSLFHSVLDGVPCGSGYNDYWFLLSATPTALPCVADVAGAPSGGDGVVDGTDFVEFINSFAIGDVAVSGLADINADGVIDGTDFVEFINAFALGC